MCNQGTLAYTGGGSTPSDDPTKAGGADPTCVDAPAPALKLLKKASAPTVYSPSSITYTYTLLNDGSELIASPAVTDDKCATPVYVSGDANGDGRLGPTEAWTYRCTTTISATTTNTATATGIGIVTGRAATPATAQATVTLAQPGISLVKLINGQDTTSAPGARLQTGDAMTFTFLVTNTGTAPLTAVTVSDPTVGAVTCPTSIDPGQSATCTAARSLPAPAVGAQHTNTATATGRAPTNPDGSVPPTLSTTDQAWAYTEAKPKLGVVKKINGIDTNAAPGALVAQGSTMTVTVEVSNLGNTTVSALTVNDDVLGAVSCPVSSLAPGASTTCTATAPTPSPTSQHTDTATASGQVAPGPGTSAPLPVSSRDQAWAYVRADPGMRVTKLIAGVDTTAAPGAAVTPGQPMAVTFRVENTGNVAMTNVAVTDSVAAAVSCPSTTVGAGATMTCTASIPAPAPGSQHTDTATATGTPASTPGAPNPPPITVTDQAWAYTQVTPAFTVAKLLAGVDSTAMPGVSLPYGQSVPIRVVVHNTGNIPLSGLGATDSVVGALVCPATVPVGGTAECTGLLPAVAPGTRHTDTATVTATPASWPGNPNPAPIQGADQAWGYVKSKNSIAVVKTIDGRIGRTATGVQVGADTMTIRYRVTNTGDAALQNIALSDLVDGRPALDVSGTCPRSALAPGEYTECVLPLASPDPTAQHHDTVTATAQPAATVGDPNPAQVTAGDQAYAVRTANPGMAVSKSIDGDNADSAPGAAVSRSTMSVTVRLTNTGNLVLSGIRVLDDTGSGPVDVTSSCQTPAPATLPPGGLHLCTRTLPAPAFGTTGHHDVATVSATPAATPGTPNPAPITQTDGAYAYRAPAPAITVVKRIDGDPAESAPGIAVGPTMQVSFAVTNSGDAPLTGLRITDLVRQGGAAGTPTPVTDCQTPIPSVLAPGATYTCMVARTSPAVGMQHSDTVTVAATPPDTPLGPTPDVTATDTSFAYRTTAPALSLIKYVNGINGQTAWDIPGVRVQGPTMQLMFVLRNTGDVPLTSPTILDSTDGGGPVPVTDCATPIPAVLQPGEHYDCAVTRPSPAIGAQHLDEAVASATPPSTPADPSPAPVSGTGHAYRAPVPSVVLVKRINGDPSRNEPGVGVTGSTMTVTFDVTNTGDSALDGVVVTDESFSKPIGGAYTSTGTTAVTCPKSTLSPGETMICTRMEPGPALGIQHRDDARVTAQPPATPGGASAPVSATDTTYAYLRMAPSIGVVKIVNGQRQDDRPGPAVSGDTMTVDFVITNTGDAPLDSLTVTDTSSYTVTATGAVVSQGTTDYSSQCAQQAAGQGIALPLRPGASFTCTVSSYPTPPVGALHEDTVTVTGMPPATPLEPVAIAVAATDTRHVYRTTKPALSVLKTANGLDGSTGPVPVADGQPYTVRIRVTNSGDVALTGFSMVDEVGGTTTDLTAQCAASTPASLAPGGSFYCDVPLAAVSGVGTVVTDTATVSATAPATPDRPTATTVTAGDSLDVTPGVVPDLAVLKLLDGASYSSGQGLVVSTTDPVTVQVRITNNGNVVLDTVRVTDTIVENGVTRTVVYTSGTPGAGEVALNCPALADGLAPGESVYCPLPSITPGPSLRSHTDSILVAGDYPPVGGQPGGTVSTAPPGAVGIVTFQARPGASLAKLVDGVAAPTAPGVAVKDADPLALTFLVTNTGNVPLRDLAVTDAMNGGAAAPVSCPATTLAVGASMTCTATAPAPGPGGTHSDLAAVSAADAGDPAATPAELARAEGHAHFDSKPELGVVKSINGVDASVAPGVPVATTTPLSISYEVVNRGNVPVSGLSVTDVVTDPAGATVGPVDCQGITSIAPGDSVICTATASGLQPGQTHLDTATAGGTYPLLAPDGSTMTGTTSASATGHAHFLPQPGVAVQKSIDGVVSESAPGLAVSTPGEPLRLGFRLSNTGNVPWTGVTATDAITTYRADGTSSVQSATLICPVEAATLAPGGTALCTYSAPALGPGERHEDLVTVDTTTADRTGAEVHTTATSRGFAHFDSRPSLAVVKSVEGVDATVAPGVPVSGSSPLSLGFTVTNTGNVPVTGLSLADHQLLPVDSAPTVTCEVTTLGVGEVTTCHAIGTALRQGGRHEDRAVATAQAIGAAGPVTVTSPEAAGFAYFDARPTIRVEKTLNRRLADPPVYLTSSDPVLVRARVTNTGNVDLTSLAVHDDQPSPSARTLDLAGCTSEVTGQPISVTAPLPPGEAAVCVVDTAAAGPLPGNPHVDTVTVTVTAGTTATDGTPLTATASATATGVFQPTPSFVVTKLIDGQEASSPTGVDVQPGPLAVTVRITNTGNVELTGLTGTNRVIEPTGTPSGTVSCPPTTLAVGESMICTVTGIDAPPVGERHHGQVTFTATAVGVDAGTTQQVGPVTAEGYAKVASVPALKVVKSINGGDANLVPGRAVAAGSTMDITVDVANTGNGDLMNVVVDDPQIPGLACPVDRTIPVGGTLRCTARVPAPAAGVQYTNMATASATGVTDVGGTAPTVSGSDVANAYVDATPSLTLSKLVAGRPGSDTAPGASWAPGTPMPIEIVVTNSGSIPVSGLAIDDPGLPAGALTCPAVTTLDPGASLTCAATVSGPAAGTQYINTATVTGQAPGVPGGLVQSVSANDTMYAYGAGTASLSVIKTILGDDANSAPGVVVPQGQPLPVVIVATNDGTVPLTGVAVTDRIDERIPGEDPAVTEARNSQVAALSCEPVTTLRPGESIRCTGTLLGHQPGEQHHDVATATGFGVTVPGQAAVQVSSTDGAYAHVDGVPQLSITKTINGDDADASPGVGVTPGGNMQVVVTVTNTGTVDVLDVAVADPVAGAALTCDGQTLLRPGWATVCTAVLPAPDAGTIHHDTATATGHAPSVTGQTPRTTTVTDEAYAYGTGSGGLSVVKKIDGTSATTAPGVLVEPGAPMEITVEVINPGVVPVTGIVVDDPVLPTLDCGGVSTLAPGQALTCTATQTAPATGQLYRNDVTASGQTVSVPGQPARTVSASTTVYAHARATGSLTLSKRIDGTDADLAPGVAVTPGGAMTVGIDVTNSGTVPVSDLEVTDPWLPAGTLRCPTGITLAVGQTVTCTAVVPAAAAGEQHHNTATASGDAQEVPGEPARRITVLDEAYAYGVGAGVLEVTKRINGDDAATAPGVLVGTGSSTVVTISVRNSGTTPVTDIGVSDLVSGGAVQSVQCPLTELAAGQSMDCTALAIPAPATGSTHEDTATATGLTVAVPGAAAVGVSGSDTAFARVAPVATVSNTPATMPVGVTTTYAIPGDGTTVFAPTVDTTLVTTVTGTDGVPTVIEQPVVVTTSSTPPPTTTRPLPILELRKSIDGDDADFAPGVTVTGPSMTIGFEVRNGGEVPFRDLRLSDDALPSTVLASCPALPDVLAPGAVYRCAVTVPAPEPGGSHVDVASVTAREVVETGVGREIESRNPANAHRPAPTGPITSVPPVTTVVTTTLTQPTTLTSEVPTTVTSAVSTTVVTTLSTEGSTVLSTVVTQVPTTLVTTSVASTVVTTPLVTTVTSVMPGTSAPSAPPTLRVAKHIDGHEAEIGPGVSVTGARMTVEVIITNLGPGAVRDVRVRDDEFPSVTWDCPIRDLAALQSTVCRAVVSAPGPGEVHVDTVWVDAADSGGRPAVGGRDVAHAHGPASVGVTSGGSTVPSTPSSVGSLVPIGPGLVGLCLSLCPAGSGGVSLPGGVVPTGVPVPPAGPGTPGVPLPPEGPGAPIGPLNPPGPGKGAVGPGAGTGTSAPGGRSSGSGAVDRDALAATGADIAGLLAGVPILVIAGIALVAISRRPGRRGRDA